IVAESYIAEHKLQLKETALAVAEDLGDMYYDLIHNPALFTKTLNTEAIMVGIAATKLKAITIRFCNLEVLLLLFLAKNF
ncbi:MAG: hypothetical protein O7C59_12130, partial [Rickettsia endosymbiont of Ixodes persulcatus]|nr:hypothetical protein [Rickettsia endosymbiont of Ixodes persulcatus]